MTVPHLIDRFYIMLIHCEFAPVLFCTFVANESPIGDISMGGFVFLAIDAEDVELVTFDDFFEHLCHSSRLLLVEVFYLCGCRQSLLREQVWIHDLLLLLFLLRLPLRHNLWFFFRRR